MYRYGQIIIDEIYTYELNGKEKVHISYRYR